MTSRVSPEFRRYMAMMRKADPAIQEEGFHLLRPRASQFLDQLIGEFKVETDRGLRCWLLELIGEAESPDAIQILVESLASEDGRIRSWAETGLEQLGSKAARRALYEYRKPQPKQGGDR